MEFSRLQNRGHKTVNKGCIPFRFVYISWKIAIVDTIFAVKWAPRPHTQRAPFNSHSKSMSRIEKIHKGFITFVSLVIHNRDQMERFVYFRGWWDSSEEQKQKRKRVCAVSNKKQITPNPVKTTAVNIQYKIKANKKPKPKWFRFCWNFTRTTLESKGEYYLCNFPQLLSALLCPLKDWTRR